MADEHRLTFKEELHDLLVTTDKQIVRLERALYNYSVRMYNSQVDQKSQIIYINNSRILMNYLMRATPIITQFINGEITADELLQDCLSEVFDPREKIRRMFIQSLNTANYAGEKTIPEVAKQIEISCYNATVKISKESEDPPRRQWDSESFVDIYSTKCGMVNSMINKKFSSCREYGPVLIDKLIKCEVAPDKIGDMTVAELCPQATILERIEINKRIGQKVNLKVSTLFRCDHCGARECSYQEVQRRALDESPDYVCLCLKCGRNFMGKS